MRLHRRSLWPAVLLCAVALPAAAGGIQFKAWLDKAKQAVHVPASGQAGANLPIGDITAGLKEALAKGTTHAIKSLGRNNGFWDNPKVRIPLPGKLEQVAGLARKFGMGAQVDAFELSLNRAAEKAVPQVADIFGNAIRKMTLKDARGILQGGDHAATDYFRRVAGPALVARIEPIVAKATSRVGVTEKYKALTTGSGSALDGALGSLESLRGGHANNGGANPLDLDRYVTDKTIAGLFTVIGEQEKSIRDNPAARTTDLLKKVFGGR
ncbi:DUF4197 domain-containing protein [Dyella sp. A6]|uniref:DUF4197 domain-containing protein n=1 Tax=Dyella aluminiiresistens TaxID=3069105 RepID=UPI002E77D685|nr:DUF4197 domain-containing protein [Dyella sp. A6]